MKRIFLIVMSLLIVVGFIIKLSIAANTVSESGLVVTVTSMDSDFLWSDNIMMYGRDGKGARLNFILFEPGDDTQSTLTIYEGSIASGALLVPFVKCEYKTDQKILYFGGARLRPIIDYSACSIDEDARITFMLWPQQ